MGALFNKNSGLSRPVYDSPSINPVPTKSQKAEDPTDYVEEMISRSGGDAKAAFYLACKEKGVDPDVFLKKLSSLGNPMAYVQNSMMSNPKIKNLLNLIASVPK